MAAGHVPGVVYTQPDRPTGRGRRLIPSPVKRLAIDVGIHDVRQPRTLRGETLPDLDVLIVAAYGLILPPAVLAAPHHGCINVHASLLPRWRGAAPVERAIMAGDRRTGVCIMQMEAGLDTGPVYRCEETTIEPADTGASLEHRLAALGARALLATLERLGTETPRPQDGQASYAHKLGHEDSIIDWYRPAHAIVDQVRALCERAPAFTRASNTRVKVLAAARAAAGATAAAPGTIIDASRKGIVVACGDGAVAVTRLQLDRGKGKPLDAAAALNGFVDLFTPGNVLHVDPAQ